MAAIDDCDNQIARSNGRLKYHIVGSSPTITAGGSCILGIVELTTVSGGVSDLSQKRKIAILILQGNKSKMNVTFTDKAITVKNS